ncbi:MAG: hypothetical protein QOJ77_2188, partial [Microbacteriaceae bacterium]|nr:hypothetical protein [Microbacteriaceae bacterium]
MGQVILQRVELEAGTQSLFTFRFDVPQVMAARAIQRTEMIHDTG